MARNNRRSLCSIGLALALSWMAAPARADIDQTFEFQDALGSTTMTVAFDGTNYWTSSGGGTSGIRFAQYDAAGTSIATFEPGLDFRSIFTDAAGTVYARQFADATIFVQTAPGTFASFLTLVGGTLDSQSSVVLNGLGTEYIAMINGEVSRWDLSGNSLGSTTLIGYGTMGTELDYPQSRGIAAVGSTWLTYSDGVQSTWDFAGNRIETDALINANAGQSFNSYFSISYANSMTFVVDQPGGTWRGYGVRSVPEPGSLALLGMGLGGLALGIHRKRKVGRTS